MVNDPRNQPQYQVRFGVGHQQARELAPGCDVVVWVDALAEDVPAVEPTVWALTGTFSILAAGTGAAAAVAHWVLAKQQLKGDRVTVAVIAAGDPQGSFRVGDVLAAGAIVDALADAGVDYISPEAASAVAAFSGLRSAHDHLLSASVAGQELLRDVGRESLEAAIASNAQARLSVLRE